MSRKRKRALPPRTLRMTRAGRLQSARHWLTTQTGRTATQIAKSYRKRFGVDWPCAIRELSTLGVRLDPQWVEQLSRALEGAQRARREQRERLKAEADASGWDSDDYFACIMGYTPGGAPYGVTWEEWRQMEEEHGQTADGECPF